MSFQYDVPLSRFSRKQTEYNLLKGKIALFQYVDSMESPGRLIATGQSYTEGKVIATKTLYGKNVQRG